MKRQTAGFRSEQHFVRIDATIQGAKALRKAIVGLTEGFYRFTQVTGTINERNLIKWFESNHKLKVSLMDCRGEEHDQPAVSVQVSEK